MPKTAERTELGALLDLQAAMLQARGGVVLARDDRTGRIVVAVPDAATVEYTLKIRGYLPPVTEELPRKGHR